MKVLYVRISTVEQNTDRQRVNASDYDYVVEDKISGSTEFSERPGGKENMRFIFEKMTRKSLFHVPWSLCCSLFPFPVFFCVPWPLCGKVLMRNEAKKKFRCKIGCEMNHKFICKNMQTSERNKNSQKDGKFVRNRSCYASLRV